MMNIQMINIGSLTDESEGILLFSYLYVLFYKFLLSVMPVCI